MTLSATELQSRRRAFRKLHEAGCFVIPNPWDVGSARYLQRLGFKALATTSAGASWSAGKPDGDLTLDEVIAHVRAMAEATELPLNVDFESGFSEDAAGVARSVARAIEAGASALSIEDATGSASDPIRGIEEAIERMKVARAAIDQHGPDVLLVGRAENFFHGRPDLQDTLTRLKAYSQAGADVLYAPGIKTRAEIEAVVAAVAPKPVNLLIGSDSEFTLADVAAMGVRRISVGGALARAAWGGFMQASRSIAEQGRFVFPQAASGKEINGLFASR